MISTQKRTRTVAIVGRFSSNRNSYCKKNTCRTSNLFKQISVSKYVFCRAGLMLHCSYVANLGYDRYEVNPAMTSNPKALGGC